MADPLSCVLKAGNRTNGFDLILTKGSQLQARGTLPIVARDWTVTLKSGAAFTFGGDFVRRIGGSESTSVAGSWTTDIKGDFRSQVAGNVVTHTLGTRVETVDQTLTINTPTLELNGTLLVAGTIQSQTTLGGLVASLDEPRDTKADGLNIVPLTRADIVGSRVDLGFNFELNAIEVGRAGIFTIDAGVSFFGTGNSVVYLKLGDLTVASSSIVRGTGLAVISVTQQFQVGDNLTLVYQTDTDNVEGLGGPLVFPSRTAWLNMTRIV